MAPPSLTKKDLFLSPRAKVGWGTFIFPFLYDFSPRCLHLSGDPTSDGPRPGTINKRSNTRPYGFWLMPMSGSVNKLSSHPHEDKICVLFSLCQTGHLGNRNGSRVWAWLDWWKKHRLIGVSLQIPSENIYSEIRRKWMFPPWNAKSGPAPPLVEFLALKSTAKQGGNAKFFKKR